MTEITLRVLDGSDRGRVFEHLITPVTIGREEGNSIQLNDERISRFHLKIQEDHDKLVLTDLESTNGTRVNGEDVRLRILRYGDMITVGRSILLFGSRDEIVQRMTQIQGNGNETAGAAGQDYLDSLASQSPDLQSKWNDQHEHLLATMQDTSLPRLPEGLSPAQAAQVSEMIEFIHGRVRNLLGTVQADTQSQQVQLDLIQWQNLLDMQSRLSEYLRSIGEPDSGE